MKILLTGGLGYIGSHIANLLGKKAVIIDDLSNSNLNFKRLLPNASVYVNKINIKNLNNIFKQNLISGVIHLAGFKSVNQSVYDPIKYYKNNFTNTIDLLESMEKFRIKKLIFSSSATVYSSLNPCPLKEDGDLNSDNPYGNTKIFIEKMISDYALSDKNFKAISLRYFNPIGANYKKKLRDQPLGEPQNIIPILINSIKNNEILKIFGNDYDTHDGTCIRDYIHVEDLANAHILSLKKIKFIKGHMKINIGLGKGLSVLELIKIFEKTNNLKINFKFTERRNGDSPVSFADNKLAKEFLSWKPKFDYRRMVKDSWKASNLNL